MDSEIIAYTPEGKALYATSMSPMTNNFGETIMVVGTSVEDGNELWYFDPKTKKVW